jgi:ABC transport system ATP-binding/permease protein
LISHAPLRSLVYLEFLTGPLAGVTMEVTKPVVTIGRSVGNDIVLMDPKVSRSHARLYWSKGGWYIEKLSQRSEVSVNEHDVERMAVADKSMIRLGGDTSLRFRLGDPATVAATVPATHQTLAVSGPAEAAPAGSSSAGDSGPTGTELASPADLGFPWLEIVDQASNSSSTHILVEDSISIGRDDHNDIVLDEPWVSAQHLQLVRQGKEWQLIHPHPLRNATGNGLIYQGRQIQGQETFRNLLVSGDQFSISNKDSVLVTLTYHEGEKASQAAPARVQQIPLGATDVSIGRAQDNDLILDHPQVSAHHARLVKERGVIRLIDLGSTNHTYVNGLNVSSQVLQPGNEIRIGPYKIVYEGLLLTLYDESGGVRIDAQNLVQQADANTILLHDVSISIQPRSFVALVGASGAGKSTLLNALSGLRPPVRGKVFYNGQDFQQHRAALRSQIGYVPQDEIIHRDLTVERALFYAARLRLPSDFSQTQIEQRIDEVLDEVEMRHRRRYLVRNLSGGQRKRVSIALELLANPSVFFLDEPTSGLDPGLDRKMMLLLRKLADKGHTIVLVTHATSNINVCDYVCFLAQGGYVAYFGPPEDASAYFGQPGFAEIYTTLEPTSEQPDRPYELGQQFRQSAAYGRYIEAPLGSRPTAASTTHRKERVPGTRLATPGFRKAWKQFVLITTRYLELLWNDKKNLAILLFQAPVIALLLVLFIRELNDGGIFGSAASLIGEGDAQKFLFVMTFSAVMFGCINASREIVKEIHIYLRERAVSLGILPYLFSKIAVLGILCMLQCIALVLILNWAAPFGNGIFLGAFWEIYITLALAALGGLLMGLAISALVPNSDQAMSFIPVVLIPQVVFSGAIFPLTQVYLQIMSVVFVARWAMAAVGSSVHLNGALLGGDKLFGTCSSCTTYRDNQHYLLTLWLVLFAMILVLTVVTGILLKRKDTAR